MEMITHFTKSDTAYHQDHQHLLSPDDLSTGFSAGQTSHAPFHNLHDHSGQYHHSASPEDFDRLKVAEARDAYLKSRIRRLRVLSRSLATCISIAVMVPMSMTTTTYLQTNNTYRTVTANGQTESRTAWAKDTKVWPTYMYLSTATLSTTRNIISLIAYKFGTRRANTASTVSTIYSALVTLAHLVVWLAAVSLYRLEKDKNGKSNDLWGWTCSAAADALQNDFATVVNFGKNCSMQTMSWYVGILQVAAALLTLVTYCYVYMRNKSKKNVKRLSKASGFEQTR